MKCTLLGTSSAVGMPAPLCNCSYCNTITRTRPSLYIKTENKSILFDASPDIRQQTKNNDITNIDAIFLTHHHHDHASGLKEITHTTLDENRLQFDDVDINIKNWLGKNYDLYCSKYTQDELITNLNYVVSRDTINMNIIQDSKTIVIDDIKITPFISEHTLGYLGFIIEHKDKKIVYHPDYGELRTKVEFNDIDVLVIDGSSLLGYDIHGNKKQFENIISKINPNNILFTNISEHIAQKDTNQLKQLYNQWNNSIINDGHKF